jgi:hypothetical protein
MHAAQNFIWGSGREQRVEFAAGVQGVEVIATADMAFTDENLGNVNRPEREIISFRLSALPVASISTKSMPLSASNRLAARAITAELTGVDGHGRHGSPAFLDRTRHTAICSSLAKRR